MPLGTLTIDTPETKYVVLSRRWGWRGGGEGEGGGGGGREDYRGPQYIFNALLIYVVILYLGNLNLTLTLYASTSQCYTLD